jgi:hypothetical protein
MASTHTIEDSGNANTDASAKDSTNNPEAVAWMMDLVRDARKVRDNKYKPDWDRYERVYRGRWSSDDRARDGERSRLISPALLQAVDSTSAAIEDAIFGRAQWFDMRDDVKDQDVQDIIAARECLKEDLETAGVPDAIAKCVFNATLYGTGVGKINVIRKRVTRIENGPEGPREVTESVPLVTLEPVAPWEFVIDSNARSTDEALFCANERTVPQHKVWEKQAMGVYRKGKIGPYYASDGQPAPGGEPLNDEQELRNEKMGGVWITEYCGKVPAKFLKGQIPEGTPRDAAGMVEVIATIANENTLLRLKANPFIGQDRPYVAFQFNTIPGRFWGMGVCEKGWNSQKALDAELRARMDALGLLTSPMMGADITRLPRNPDMKVRPGKVWMTRGRPSEVLEPVILGNLNPNTFNQSAEMERMVQVATGAIDSNAPLDQNRRNETASGISMIQSAALKRMRRTMWNLERQFLNPFIRKAAWRMMQFNPGRYPKDYSFEVSGTMGIVAKEYEQANLTALLSVISPEHPTYSQIIRGIIELSGVPQRNKLVAAIEQASQPSPEEQQQQQMMQQLQMRAMAAEVAKAEAEVAKTQAEALLANEKARHERIVADLEDEKIDIQAMNAVTGRDKTRQAFEQNDVARERNEIDRIKARKESKSKGD